jgi:pyruvate,water dikinase
MDLELVGALAVKRTLVSRLDPRPPVRRLGAAWRVGRLRAALPALASDIVRRVDAELASVPPVADLPDELLLRLLTRARQVLVSLHGHEMLAGLLPPPSLGEPTAAGVALAALAGARRSGLDDDDVLAAHPVVLALVAPSIADRGPLPVHVPAGDEPAVVAALGPREALRLRVRWVHELTAVAARELGRRLVERGGLDGVDDVAMLTFAELEDVVAGRPAPGELAGRAAAESPPLPAAFRLGAGGGTVAVRLHGAAGKAGQGAGGGRASGTVHDGSGPLEGAVLVVTSLDPRLAPQLPALRALVAETGSPLSHLAILAREHGVATVVGVPDAVRRFPPGTSLLVDGTSGDVTVLT